MSSLRNAFPRGPHKERAQLQSRKKIGLLEKHKDYVVRARAFQKKEETLRRLKEKAAFRNPDEFYFKMIKTKTVRGVHMLESQANKYTQEELMLMKTQDVGYVLQRLQSEKKKIEKLTAVLHSLDKHPSNRHVYYAEDRLFLKAVLDANLSGQLEHSSCLPIIVVLCIPFLCFAWEEAKEMQLQSSEGRHLSASEDVPSHIKKKIACSYRELEARRNRVNELEKLHMDMSLQKELQKNGWKRKLREDEIVCPTSKPVYKWRSERKR